MMVKKGISIFFAFLLISSILGLLTPVNAKKISIDEDLNAADGSVNKFAVLIGTDPYVYSDNDADEMYSVLTSDKSDWDEVRKYTKSRATKSNMLGGIDWLASVSDSDDIIMFFFSGHGGRRVIADYYQSPIFLIELKLALSAVRASTQVLIFDTCHAGSLMYEQDREESEYLRSRYFEYSGDGGGGDEEIDEKGLFGLSAPGREILVSCRAYEYSFGAFDFKMGIFTYYLTQALKTKSVDTNSDGWNSAQEAFSNAKPKTTSKSREYSMLGQHPQITDLKVGHIKIVESGKEGSRERFSFEFFERFLFFTKFFKLKTFKGI